MISLSNDCSETLGVLFRTSFLTFAICIGCDFFFSTAPSSGSFLLNNYASIYFFLWHFTVGDQATPSILCLEISSATYPIPLLASSIFYRALEHEYNLYKFLATL